MLLREGLPVVSGGLQVDLSNHDKQGLHGDTAARLIDPSERVV
jgi:hypothetical protein